MRLLAFKIWKLVKSRLSDDVKNRSDFSEMGNAFDDLFFKLMCEIFTKSQIDDTHQFVIQVLEDTDIKIVAIVEYIVNVFENASDYASRFEKLRSNFCWFIMQDDIHFSQSRTVATLNKKIPLHEESIVFFGKLLDHIAPFEECMFSIDCAIFSHSRVKSGLEELHDEIQKDLYHYKCMIALIAIVTTNTDTDANTTVHALLNRRDDDISEKMHTAIKNTSLAHYGIGGHSVIKDHRQRCAHLVHIAILLKANGVHLKACTAADVNNAPVEAFTTTDDA